MVNGSFRRAGGYGRRSQAFALLVVLGAGVGCSGKTMRLPDESTGGSHAGSVGMVQGGNSAPDEPPSNDGGSVIIAGRGGEASGGNGGKTSKGGTGGGPPIDMGMAEPKLLTHFAASCSGTSLALAGPRLYYTDSLNGTVASIATSGKSPLTLATDQAQPTQIAVANNTVYWLARGAQSVMTASASGGPSETVASDADGINGFTLDQAGTSLYFSSRTFVFKTTAAPFGVARMVGGEDSGYPTVLALSGNRIATPTDINGDVDVMRLDPDDPALCASEDAAVANHNCVRVSRSQGSLLFNHIELIDDQVYWANGPSIFTSSASMPSGFNDTVVQATSPLANMLTAFAIYGNQVYFADDSGTVYRAPLMINANPTVIAHDQGIIGSMVTDGVGLYWISANCAISSLVVK
jgi:hypothetical protein